MYATHEVGYKGVGHSTYQNGWWVAGKFIGGWIYYETNYIMNMQSLKLQN